MNVLFLKRLGWAFILTLVISNSSVDFFQKNLPSFDTTFTSALNSASDILLSNKFDLIIVNPPFLDENLDLFLNFVSKNSNAIIILTISSKNAQLIREKYSKLGIIFLEKPLSSKAFSICIDTIFSSLIRFEALKSSNDALHRQIDDIKIIDRAKFILISTLKMDEKSAHKFIEQQAMNLRKSKRQIAENILKTYEN